MSDVFKKNRYDFSQLIENISNSDAVADTMVDKTTGIEIYGCSSIPKGELISILQEFNHPDNMVQDECRCEYEEGKADIKNYLFEPSWIEISGSEITIGYCGTEVNSSFDKVFVKADGEWIMQ